MPDVENDRSLDYSLTMSALYTAFYLKENPYVDSKESAFVLSKKPSSTFRDRLLEKAEDKRTPIFARPSDYSTILSTYYSGMPKKTASSNSGSHRTFLVTHLGGWRSGKTDLANVTDPIFHDNGRSAGSVREEFCEELLNWKYSRDEKGSCRFLKNGESMGNPLSAGSRPLSEYIVECNYTLISNFYVRKSVLRQVIIDFASNMYKAEEMRRDNGQNNLISDPENKEGIKELCDCLNKIMEAYDQLPETESQREWLISRAFTWLVIAAFLREYITPYVIEQCMKQYMFNTYQTDIAEKIKEIKKKVVDTLSPFPATKLEPDVRDFLSVRKLADGLWVNWKTGCLAGNFMQALEEHKKGNPFPCLPPLQLRLLSILVQGEGAVISWKEIFRRGKLLHKWQEKYAECNQKGIIPQEDHFLPGDRRTITLEEIKDISIASINELQETINDARRRINQFLGINGAVKPENLIQMANTGIGCRLELPSDNMDVQNNKETPIRQYHSLFCGHEGCRDYTEYDDYTLLNDEIESNGRKRCREVSAWLRRYYDRSCSFFENRVSNKGSENVDSSENEIFGDYKMVQAYMMPYASFGKGSQKDGQVHGIMSEISEKDTDGVNNETDDESETILDFVEWWHLTGENSGRIGRVLVLHGQPGDGKTTFCKKAVYAHCKEGWLPNTSLILQFSLNPAESEIIENNRIRFENVFCIKGEEDQRFPLSLQELKNMLVRGRRENFLRGSLIILDGYDELAGSLGSETVSITFSGFYDQVKVFAENNACNVIITSRSMCIEAELKGEKFSDFAKTPVIAFAPLTVEQQDAMIDRMIELDARKECSTRTPDAVSGFDILHRNLNRESEGGMTLEDYKEVLAGLRKKGNRKFEDFRELLKIPILFRMIVHKRFYKFEKTDTVAELYGYLFYELLSQKSYEAFW